MYTTEGIQSGIENCKRNIKALKEAIAAEQSQIASYRIMLDDIERADKAMAEAEANVHVEIVNGVS